MGARKIDSGLTLSEKPEFLNKYLFPTWKETQPVSIWGERKNIIRYKAFVKIMQLIWKLK